MYWAGKSVWEAAWHEANGNMMLLYYISQGYDLFKVKSPGEEQVRGAVGSQTHKYDTKSHYILYIL